MGSSLAVAACVHVRASSKRVARSFSVVDVNAERRASSAYRRNSVASDMTALLALARSPMEPAPNGTVESGQNRSLPLRRTKKFQSEDEAANRAGLTGRDASPALPPAVTLSHW